MGPYCKIIFSLKDNDHAPKRPNGSMILDPVEARSVLLPDSHSAAYQTCPRIRAAQRIEQRALAK
jgi:hypothetical protein